jgi:hypothetical protein
MIAPAILPVGFSPFLFELTWDQAHSGNVQYPEDLQSAALSLNAAPYGLVEANINTHDNEC